MQKTLKNIFIIIIYVSIFILLSCKEDVGLYYYPEKMAEYLTLREDQRETVLPKLTAIQGEIFRFFEKWGKKFRTPYGFETEDTQIEFEKEREAAVNKIIDIVEELTNLLDEQQKVKLFNVEIPTLYFEEAMVIQREYLMEEQKKENPVVEVMPTINEKDIPAKLPDLSELQDEWTVTFGMSRGRSGGLSFTGGGESPAAGMGFPLKIKATLLDPLLVIAQKRQGDKVREFSPDSAVSYFNSIERDVLEIQVSITTSYHESYLDLKNWIVYLENDKIEQFEPWKIEKREKPFIEQSRTFRLPYYQRRIQTPTVTDIPDMEPSRIFGDVSKSAYYSIFFRDKIQGKPLIREDTEFLKLIFLKEIGTSERSEGKWIFSRREYY